MEGLKPRKSMEEFTVFKVPTVHPGTPTFLGVPSISEEDLSQYDAAIIGVPLQRTTPPTGRSLKPSILHTHNLRVYSLKYGSYLPEYDVDVLEKVRLGDLGDLKMVSPVSTDEDYLQAIRRNKDAVEKILLAGCVPIVVTGHPFAAAEALSSLGKIGILHLDAHGDNLQEHSGTKYSLACWVRRASELQNLDMRNFVLIGLRGPRNMKSQIEWYRKHGARIYTYRDIVKEGYEKVLEEALRLVREDTDAYMVNVDFDVLDLSMSEGLDEPLGISTWQLLQTLKKAGENARLYNIETFPSLHPSMYHIATWSILYFLLGKASNHRR
ncbi:MAG TPA: hypothetical protein ENF42_00460 [Candidatus Bathyarchaeota archaeon]|nr:hypothetical protein [Candidatus Bathyarchaeota archaeon]